MNEGGLKSLYCYEFSEKTLVYKVLDLIYIGKCIKFSGQDFVNKRIDGAPDFYIRKGKNILLFESKDFLIKADKKASFNYHIYEEEFAKTLYFENLANGKEKAGAIKQLINSIRKILKNELDIDKDYYFKEVFIFPILIIHDHQYDTPGFSSLLNYWFKIELNKLANEGFFIHHIKPLVLINIDSLVFHQLGLTNEIPLHEVIKLYYEHTKINSILKFNSFDEYKDYRLSKLISFSLFIDKLFLKKDISKLPPVLDLVLPTLFKEELEKSKNKII